MKTPREYISPLLHPPLNKLFIARPRIDCRSGLPDLNKFPDKPKPSSITLNDLERLAGLTNSSKASALNEKEGSRVSSRDETLQAKIAKYKPPINLKTDPRRTLFIGRLPYTVSERLLRREFEDLGTISQVILVDKLPSSNDKNIEDDKSRHPKKKRRMRGFAFIEFERERDARRCYRDVEKIRFDARCVAVIDWERSRTVPGWLPRRLGGGLGGRHAPQGRDPRGEKQLPDSEYTKQLEKMSKKKLKDNEEAKKSTSSLSSSTSSSKTESTSSIADQMKHVPKEDVPIVFQGRQQIGYDDI